MSPEIKTRFVLRHESGRFLSWSPENFPLTPKLSQARRFTNLEEISAFMQTSPYCPKNLDEFEIVEIEMEYRLKEGITREQSTVISENR